ncbi:MAG: hypothetical protein ACRYFZ_09120 [Janthinobacterium lividum]
MQSSRVGALFLKCFVLASPFLLIVATYLYFDPAQILRHYTDFNHLYLLNRDFVSTQTFINNNPTQHYQSFILGNSRSGAYLTTDWAPHIHDRQPYHFDAAGESLSGVYGKIKFLDRQGNSLRNVLIVWDRTLLKYTGNPPGGPLFAKDSRASENSWAEFQTGFLKAYFADFYFIDFLKQKHTEKSPPASSPDYYFVPISNDMPMVHREAEIRQDSSGYYIRHLDDFKQKHLLSVTEAAPTIQKQQLAVIQGIAEVFRKHHTNYQIIISPLLDKVPLNEADVQAMQAVFGADHVHNYSGQNAITEDYHNYYEASHYRPHIARQIMREIYSPSVK